MLNIVRYVYKYIINDLFRQYFHISKNLLRGYAMLVETMEYDAKRTILHNEYIRLSYALCCYGNIKSSEKNNRLTVCSTTITAYSRQ